MWSTVDYNFLRTEKENVNYYYNNYIFFTFIQNALLYFRFVFPAIIIPYMAIPSVVFGKHFAVMSILELLIVHIDFL